MPAASVRIIIDSPAPRNNDVLEDILEDAVYDDAVSMLDFPSLNRCCKTVSRRLCINDVEERLPMRCIEVLPINCRLNDTSSKAEP